MIESLLPVHKNPPFLGGGQPRVLDQVCAVAIFFVLRTGCQRNALNATGLCASSTAHDRFQAWVADGFCKSLAALAARPAMPSSAARASKAPLKARRAASTAARRSRAARATWPLTARARSWPCTSRQRTKPTEPKPPLSWSRRASGILPSRASPRMVPTSARPSRSPVNSLAWNCTSPPSPRSPSPTATGSKKGFHPGQVPLAGRAYLRVVRAVSAALQGV